MSFVHAPKVKKTVAGILLASGILLVDKKQGFASSSSAANMTAAAAVNHKSSIIILLSSEDGRRTLVAETSVLARGGRLSAGQRLGLSQDTGGQAGLAPSSSASNSVTLHSTIQDDGTQHI